MAPQTASGTQWVQKDADGKNHRFDSQHENCGAVMRWFADGSPLLQVISVLFFEAFGLLLGDAQDIKGIANADANQVGPKELQGIEQRQCDSPAGNRNEQRKQKITKLQIEMLGQRLAALIQIIGLPIAQYVEFAQRMIENLHDLFAAQ